MLNIRVRVSIKLAVVLLVAIFLSACAAQQSAVQQADEEPISVLVGSINSDKYHYEDCEWAKRIKPENQIWFSSPEEARKTGYKPCKICRPPDHRLLDYEVKE